MAQRWYTIGTVLEISLVNIPLIRLKPDYILQQ